MSTPGRGRLLAVDAARALALLGMMANHIFPETGADGRVPWQVVITSGRASALFALLAGAGLALSTGRGVPPSGGALSAARRGVVARGAVVAVVGLTLGLRPGRIAVILVDYGLFFAIAALFLGWRARPLALTGGAWLLLSPVVSQLLRSGLPPGPGPVTSWRSLAHPLQTVTELALTGYYPALPWTGYLLVGMALGRSALASRRLAVAITAGGAVLAVAAVVVSDRLVDAAGGLPALQLALPAEDPVRVAGLPVALQTTSYGTTPTTSWIWLLTHGPHSGTPFDLLTTTGSALAVLGLCLLAGACGRPGRAALVVLAGAGSMTLTLYCAHVLLVPPMLDALAPATVWGVQAVSALAVGLAVRAGGLRGPLEQVAAEAAAAARSTVAEGQAAR